MLVSAAAAAKSFQSCPTLCDPVDGSPPGSAVSGILQARTLEWVAISFSNYYIAKWISYTYTYIPSFLYFLPISVTTKCWVEFPELYSRFSLVTYFTRPLGHEGFRSCPAACSAGIRTVPPALAGGFLTTGSPGKPWSGHFWIKHGLVIPYLGRVNLPFGSRLGGRSSGLGRWCQHFLQGLACH